MSDQYYLVCGTMKELEHISRERDIDPKSIRLIQKASDLHGYRGGKIILGVTGGYSGVEFDRIVQYAHTHNIEVP
jgi:hypothetical protein